MWTLARNARPLLIFFQSFQSFFSCGERTCGGNLQGGEGEAWVAKFWKTSHIFSTGPS